MALCAGALAGCGGEGDADVRVVPSGLTSQVPPVVRADCEAAAAQMSEGGVYCPPLVPSGSTYSQNRSSRGKVSIDARGDEYMLSFVAHDLAGFDPSQPSAFRKHHGHWLVRAVSDSAVLTRGPGVKVVKRTVVDGVSVTAAERRWVAYDLDAGHVLAVWRLAGRTFELSLHGFENHDLLLPMVRASIEQMRSCPDAAAPPGEGGCQLVFPAAPGGWDGERPDHRRGAAGFGPRGDRPHNSRGGARLDASRRNPGGHRSHLPFAQTTYHFRIVAKNRSGKTFGGDQTFTTTRLHSSIPSLYGDCPKEDWPEKRSVRPF